MVIRIAINKVLPPFEKYDKTFYPFVAEEIKRSNGSGYIFNSLVPIPEDTSWIYADLYTWTDRETRKTEFKIGNFRLTK